MPASLDWRSNDRDTRSCGRGAALAAALVPPGRGAKRSRRAGRRRRTRPRRSSRSSARSSRRTTRRSCSRPRARSCGRRKRGPKNASLEQCDLGLGAGRGEGRLRAACRATSPTSARSWTPSGASCTAWSTLQGFDDADARQAAVQQRATRTPDPVSIVTYVAGQSRGMKIAAAAEPPEGARRLRDRPRDLLLPRRRLRLLLRHLPRRGRQAHPHAAAAEPHQAGRRRSAATRAGRATA